MLTSDRDHITVVSGLVVLTEWSGSLPGSAAPPSNQEASVTLAFRAAGIPA